MKIKGEQLEGLSGYSPSDIGGKVDSSSKNASNAFNVNTNNGNVNNNNKTNTNRVRPCAPAKSPIIYGIPFSHIVEAWIDCEANKKSARSCIRFRWHAAKSLVDLWEQVKSGQYKPFKSTCFIVDYPVKREIMAASFRDRVIHHYIAIRLIPVIEAVFNECGNVSMNCRKGYGTQAAILRLEKMIWEYSNGYTEDCYIVGGDFANFFMSIDKEIVDKMITDCMLKRYSGDDLDSFMYLFRSVLWDEPQKNCIKVSPDSAWEGMPKRKSLFYSKEGCGVPIGNYPSQLIANFLASAFDLWLLKTKGINCHIRFADDFREIVRTKEQGRALLKETKEFLQEQLHITMHPNKVYLQHYEKGTQFVGSVVKPRRTYISNRTRGRFISKIHGLNLKYNTSAKKIANLEYVRSVINSYLRMMSHNNSYKLRRKLMLEMVYPEWKEYIYFEEGFLKAIIKNKYDRRLQIKKRIRHHKFAAKLIRPLYD